MMLALVGVALLLYFRHDIIDFLEPEEKEKPLVWKDYDGLDYIPPEERRRK